MARRNVVFLGNCQAFGIRLIYERHLAFDQGDRAIYVDPTKPLTEAELAILAKADLVISQVFDFPTQFSSDMLSAGCRVLRFPSVVAGFLWPHANQGHVCSPGDGAFDPYHAQLGDRYLNGLIKKEVDPATALQMYLELDVVKTAGLDRLLELNIEQQKRRDQRSGLAIAPLIEKHFRDEPLFRSPDHPNLTVFWALAKPIFAELGVSTAKINDVKRMVAKTPFPEFALPIHPKIIAHFGLRYVTPDSRYPYFDEGEFTFAEYVLRYMKFEWNEDLFDVVEHRVSGLARRIEVLDRGLEKSPNSSTGWRIRADLMLQAKRLDEAVEASGRAMSLTPNEPENWATRYRVYSALGDAETVKSTVEQAVQRFPHSSTVRRVEADHSFRTGDRVRAYAAAREAVRVASGDAYAHGFAADIATRVQRFEDAISSLSAAMALAPSEKLFPLQMTNVLEAAGRSAEAEKLLRRMMERGETDPRVYTRIGEFTLNKGELETSHAYLRRAVELDGENLHARRLLATVLERRGQFEVAKSVVAAMLSQFEMDPHLHAQMGHLHLRTNDLQAARDSFEIAVKLDDKSPWFQKNLAHAVELMGELAKAKAIIDAVVEHGDANAHIFIHQAHLFERLEDFAAAEAAYRKGIAMDGGEWGFYLAYANLLERLGRAAEAARALEAGMGATSGQNELGARLDQLRQAYSLS